ncbi:MAG: glycosyltransferase [Bacillota bacterium]|nr:glycosyltransferase [Bacillota bacterium]
MVYVCIALGLIFCSFWVAQLIFVTAHSRWTYRITESDKRDMSTGVSIIHPIKDLDFELEKNLESWMNQNYKGPVEHIFSFQEADDPAIEIVRDIISKYPEVDCKITINPVIEGLNGKSSNMVNGMRMSRYGIIMFGDSDIRIQPDFIVKMVRPLKNEKIGIMTCGQINRGGKDFWTRFFTFEQNCETDFIWAFLTKLRVDVGATGAAFAMRKKLLKEIGGLEAFGGSLLEDMHLGSTLYRMGYKVALGPFLECQVNKLEREKSLNYAKRIAIGIRTHISFELPAFIVMLFWYWALLFISVIAEDIPAIYICLGFIGLRILHGIGQRIVTGNRVYVVDLIMAPFFDLFGTFYLTYSTFSKPYVMWRGIKYEIKKGGYIEEMYTSDGGIKVAE